MSYCGWDITVDNNICIYNRVGIEFLSFETSSIEGKRIIVSDNECSWNERSGISFNSVDENPDFYDVTITGNICMNNNQENSTYDGIQLYRVMHDVIVTANRCGDDQGTKTQRYGIYVYKATSDYIIITSNNCNGNANANYDIYYPSAISNKDVSHNLGRVGTF